MLKPIRSSWTFAIAVLLSGTASLLPTRSDAAGEIYWFSLLTEDPAAASTFYSSLFGWEIRSGPTGGLLAVRDGTPIASINAIEDRIPNVSESMWLAAITVDNLDGAVAAAKELGATVHEDITSVPGWGKFALIQDPQGTAVILAVPERTLGGTEGYSGWRWAELWTHDPAAASAFYGKVVGYQLQDDIGEQRYSVLSSGGKPKAGLVELQQPEIASLWAPYVGVSDLRGILVRVWQFGGKVLREPAEIDFEAAGKNRVALIAGPTGAAMFLYQLDEKAVVDPGVAAQVSARPRSQTGESAELSALKAAPSFALHYGFGASWGGAYPFLPTWAIGPPR